MIGKYARRQLRVRFVIALVSGLLLSLLLSLHVERLNNEHVQTLLNEKADNLVHQIQERIELYQYGLRGMRGAVLTAGDDLSRELVGRYNATRNVDEEFPGARGVGFIRRVEPDAEASFLQAARADGWPDFSIRQLSVHSGERFVIQYIEPVERNLAAVGLDIASETNRREAAWSALLSGEVYLTGPITLVQATGNPQQSFLILLPVYRGGHTPASREDRLARRIGWSYAPLLMEEVLADLHLFGNDLKLELTDTTDETQPVRFFTNATGQPLAAIAPYQQEQRIYGRNWQFRVQAYPAFVKAQHITSPWLVFVLGALISVLASALFAMWLSSRLRREEFVAQQARLAAIVESSADSIISQDCHGIIGSWNQAAETMFGFSEREALGQSLAGLIVPADLHEQEHEICRAAADGLPLLPKESRRLHADGREIEVSVSYAVIRNAAGKPVGLSESIRDISAQKAAQAQIIELNSSLERQVEERAGEAQRLSQLLQSVLDSASEVAIIATDKDGIVTLFNQGAERMLGYRAEEFVGLQSPAPLHLAEEIEARSLELEHEYGGEIRGFRVFVHKPELEGGETREWTYVCKDGEHLQVSLSVTTMRNTAGEIVGYLGIAVDITARKASEAALEKSLITTQAILNTAVNPIITIDGFGIIRSFNPAGEQTFGYQADEVIGQNVSVLMPEPFASRHDLYMQRFREMTDNRAIGINREIQALRKDGSVFPAQISLGAMMLGDERIIVGIMTDISEQRAQHEALQAAMAQLAMAADVAELGVWSWTPESNELQWNDRMFELYQQPSELRDGGLHYKHWRMRIHPDDLARTEESLQAAIEGRGVYDPVFRIVLPDGQIRHIQAGARVEFTEDGAVHRVTGINRDITEQLQYETRLREAKEAADAASAAKSVFLANMSHEIRTPMNAVLGMLKLVAQTNLSERQRDYVSKSQSAATSLLSLLNDILDYSKIEAGKLHLDRHPFSIDEVMRNLAVVISGTLMDKPVEVVFDLDLSLPQSLLGDSNRLQQILINLAGNALKFTAEGFVRVSAKLAGRDDGSVRVAFSVTDSGIGISADNQQRIFEGFTQAEVSTSRRYGGTGLGLVICKRLLAMMGSELTLQSTPGQGSEFSFELTLPLVTEADYRVSMQQPPLRVLLVEDNPLTAELLQRDGRLLGWQVDLATGGAAAMKALLHARDQGSPYQVAILDWRLPDDDGVELAHRINTAMASDAPAIVLISAYGRESLNDVLCSDNPPFHDFLSKPVTPLQLAEAITRALGQPQEAQPAEPEAAGGARLANMTILVVEDNAINREIIFELLSSEGARVDLAEDGLSGVEKATARPGDYDVIIMDMQMPDIDGLEATRRIRADRRCTELPILAMTANVSESDRQACLDAGMNDHVGKPVDLDEVVQVLQTLTGRAPAGDGADQRMNSAVVQQRPELEDTETLLQRFGHNRSLLANMAGRFSTDMAALLQTLEQQWQQKLWRDSSATLHTLKGTSATMGAVALAQRSSELEQLFKDMPAEQAQCSQCIAWLDELKELLQEACAALNALTEQDPADGRNMHENWPPQRWQTELAQLAELLKANNLAALDQVESWPRECFPGNALEFKQLLQDIEQLDFPAALQRLNRLQELE